MTAYHIIENALENVQISPDAYDVVSSLIDGMENEDYTIENYLAALEDGGFLAVMGFDNQEAVEEAYEFLENL